MKKQTLYIVFIVISVGFGAVSLIFTNNAVMDGYMLKKEEARLMELNDTHGELEAEYLRIALGDLEQKAREAGFVAVSKPQYVQPDTVVGFLPSQR